MSSLDEKLEVPRGVPGRARQSLRQLKESLFGYEIVAADELGPTEIVRYGMKAQTRWRRVAKNLFEMER